LFCFISATKADAVDVKTLRDTDDIHPCMIVFDCLLLNNQILTQHPLSERLELLSTVFKRDVEGRVMMAQRSMKKTMFVY
jgi:ATP-dependent DNA ligase